MNDETRNNVTPQYTDMGFSSIRLEASHNITVQRGQSVNCNATTFFIKNDTLYISSDYNSITLTLPQVTLDKVKIDSTYGFVECADLTCNQLTVSTSRKVKLKNSQINRCEISSDYGSVHIEQSTIDNLSVNASDNVSIEVNDFSNIDIKSKYDGVKIKYNGAQLVNIDCASTYGALKTTGAFYGDGNCSKKIVVKAANNINLISGE